MTELKAEMPVKPEKESGVVKRVADRIGEFLSKTYTIKGAKANEVKKFDALYAQFTPSQSAEMKAFYEKKVGKTATWKVIRNWVATGAGVALGYGLLQPGGAAAMWGFVTDKAVPAIKGGAEAVFNWIFNPFTLQVKLPGPHTGFTLPMNLPSGPGIPIPTKINIIH